ncbi:Ubiquinone biosynthesis protein UbiH [Methylocella tundrae]|uniref:Ubiquinone biosynthesis protein UbiH n=1 Tax=Methylocella tundrae TaxID=227605 RepID=A0A8B6M5E8_METTU|nr:FAD-dependent monooxygenase [Methylocella tundrae]VTZ28155.1 Ubiquinone biosynthesis protein UbiH [Methylocella tundrae]VTZ50227.1 Ubiquinone biosynthesis protein UbiH [Methylocella tundrae]
MTQVDPFHVDILVAGAGAAGLSAAIALDQAGFSVACAGLIDRRANGRTVALFEASLRFYKSLGLWPRFRDKAAALEKIAMVDATNARFRAPSVSFAASEIGLSAFGANIENNVLVDGLAETAAARSRLALCQSLIEDICFDDDDVRATLADGRRIRAKLVVAADGRGSLARTRANIDARSWTYPQVALTALLAHAKPHRNISTEFHTRSGPCTLVPLRPHGEKLHRSSLVWLMSAADAERRRNLAPGELAREIELQVGGLLGAMELDGPCGFFPMAGMSVAKLFGRRIALIGEAAHVFPPLAAQGLNLSLRDIAALVETLEDARADGKDIGAAASLKAYGTARRGDISLRTNGVDILNRSLLTEFLPVDLMRGAGFFAFSMIGPLRRALMREGVLTHQTLPRLMQARPRRGAVATGG